MSDLYNEVYSAPTVLDIEVDCCIGCLSIPEDCSCRHSCDEEGIIWHDVDLEWEE